MGRKRNLAVREFFNYINYRNESVCKLCDSVFKGSYSTNLTRHMKSKHNETYEEVYQKAIEDNKESEKCKKVTFSIELSPSKVKDACLELVTAEKLPFSFLDCHAFKFLTEQIFTGLGMSPIYSRNIMELITEKYKLMKDDIKKLIKQKIISLKIDTATRLNRGILGINIQFVKNNTICVKTLEMIELHTSHTAENLKIEIEKVLENFDISKNQIYTITTDNGRNMLKPEELLNASVNGDFGITVDEEIDDFYENLTANLTYENIMSIRCAAHTLQLIMKDFISLHHKDLIDKSRQVAKTLRTYTYRHILTHLGSNQLELDVPACWNSTFKILQQLLKIREHLDGNFANVFDKLSVEEWTEIENLVNVLEPIHEVTVTLQKQQLCLGDYYKLWMGLKLKLESLSLKSTIAKDILQIFERRENTLIENNALISAIYLDPRLRFFLNSTKKQAAKIHLKKLATQMISLRKNTDNKENMQGASSLLSSTSQNERLPVLVISDDSTNQSTSSLLRQSLLNINISDEDSEEEDEENKELQAAYCEIETFSAKRLDIDADIMQFWEKNKYLYPTLYKLAKIVHGVPATQVSVERCSSALKLVLSGLRYNLTDVNFRKYLFVTVNTSKSG